MITIPIAKHLLLSANGREHRQQAAKITKQLREAAFWLAKTSGQEPIECPVDLTIAIAWNPLKRRRDRLNLAPTIKACVDGIVDAGVLSDDNDQVIRSETLITAPEACAPEYGAVLWFRFVPALVGVTS